MSEEPPVQPTMTRFMHTRRILRVGDIDAKGHRVLNPPVHGKRGTYVRGCQCDPCTDAESLYSRVYHRKKRGQRARHEM